MENAAKHLSLGESEGGRARPWSSGIGGLMHMHKHTHTQTHTQMHTPEQLELSSCCGWRKVSIGQFAGHAHVLGVIKEVTLADNCLQHFCYLIFAQLMDWGQQYHPPAGSLSAGVPSRQGQQRIWSSLHHSPPAWRALPPCTSPSVSFWDLGPSGLLCRGLLCEIEM